MLVAEKETIIHDVNAANLIALHVGVVENVRIKRLCRNHIFLSNCKNKCNCKNQNAEYTSKILAFLPKQGRPILAQAHRESV